MQFVNIKAWALAVALALAAGWVATAAGQPAPNPGERPLGFNRGMAALLVATAVWMLTA